MGNILTASVKIEGVRTLLWHKFGRESLPLEKQEKTGVAGNDPEEWKGTVLYTAEGQLYLPPSYVFSCLRNAGRYTKKSRSTLMKDVAATLQVVDDRILIDRHIPNFNGGLPDILTEDPNEPVYLDVRGVRNPNSKGRNIRYRVAASAGWTTAFRLIWDATIVSRAQMEAVAIDAGRLEGVGDGRSIGLGRFTIAQFEIEE